MQNYAIYTLLAVLPAQLGFSATHRQPPPNLLPQPTEPQTLPSPFPTPHPHNLIRRKLNVNVGICTGFPGEVVKMQENPPHYYIYYVKLVHIIVTHKVFSGAHPSRVVRWGSMCPTGSDGIRCGK